MHTPMSVFLAGAWGRKGEAPPTHTLADYPEPLRGPAFCRRLRSG